MQTFKTLLAATALATTPTLAFADLERQDTPKDAEMTDQATTQATAQTAQYQEPQTDRDETMSEMDASNMDDTDQAESDRDDMDTEQLNANQMDREAQATTQASTRTNQAMSDPSELDTIIIYQVGTYNPAYFASAWLGESVYNMNGEELGDVTDLVVTGDNEVAGAVISVGGLWDIGDTDVIVPIEEFDVTRYEDDHPRLRLDYTEDELLDAAEMETDYSQVDTDAMNPAQ